jgi:hypothetical protein
MFKKYGIVVVVFVIIFAAAYCSNKSYEPCCADPVPEKTDA